MKMDSKNKMCGIVQDLLPLYVDDVCGEDSIKGYRIICKCKTARKIISIANRGRGTCRKEK